MPPSENQDSADNDNNHKDDREPGQRIANRVIGIGASAGGLEALEKFFGAVPESTGFAFVVIQHLAADAKTMMGELLARVTKLPLVIVDSKPVALLQDHIYLLAPSKDAMLAGSTLSPHLRPDNKGLHLPINTFFHQMAKSWREKCTGIILSGTGGDGSSGIASIREVGGVVIAQAPETARFDGMPQRAIDTRLVDVVLSPEEMPGMLVAWDRSEQGLVAESEDFLSSLRKEFDRIYDELHHRFGVDFRNYKPSTITRRIYRRIGLLPNVGNLSDYLTKVLDDEEELKLLYHDLLIGVTRFYRDERAYEALRETGIPSVFDLVEPGEEIRVWVCGCSSGEEAYSIAMELMEARDQRGWKNPVKVFATDLHPLSIQAASEGIYNREDLESIPEVLRTKYFRPFNGNTFRPVPELRKSLIFSEHNLLKNPPFTRMHLVSCRNLLIYLNNEAQMAALVSLNFSLINGGVLFLGSSESIGPLFGDFGIIDRHWKIFKKNRDTSLRKHSIGLKDQGRLRATGVTRIREDRVQPINRIYNLLLDRMIPSGLLIGDSDELLHVFGDGHRFLKPPTGRVTGDVYPMLGDGLAIALSTAMRNIRETPGRLTYRGVRVEGNDEVLELTVESLFDRVSNSTFYIVMLSPQLGSPKVSAGSNDEARLPGNLKQKEQEFSFSEETAAYVEQLQAELQKTRELLQSNAEELETSNEELQASNEELLASNEELQSTNEELHSVNEELYSVNAEHESKIIELDQTSTDLRNLVNSTSQPIVLLDTDGKVRIFTPQAAKMFNLVPQDVGRDIRHFRPGLNDEKLLDDLAALSEDQPEIVRNISDIKQVDSFYERTCRLLSRDRERGRSVFLRYSDISKKVQDTVLVEALSAVAESSLSKFVILTQGLRVLHRSVNLPSPLKLIKVGDPCMAVLEKLGATVEQDSLFDSKAVGLEPIAHTVKMDGGRVVLKMNISGLQHFAGHCWLLAFDD